MQKSKIRFCPFFKALYGRFIALRSRQSPPDLMAYNIRQIEEMKKHKWIESQKAGRDLGEEAVRDWVNRFAQAFRDAHWPKAAKKWFRRLMGWTKGVWSNLSALLNLGRRS